MNKLGSSLSSAFIKCVLSKDNFSANFWPSILQFWPQCEYKDVLVNKKSSVFMQNIAQSFYKKLSLASRMIRQLSFNDYFVTGQNFFCRSH